jgi:Chitin binding Peritrophin-A domain
MKKLIKQIICSLMVIVAVVGLTTGDANAQSSLNPNTNVILKYSCNEANFDELYPNPEDPHTFYQCSPMGFILMPCPNNLVFDVKTNRCDVSKEPVTESKS